MQYAFKQQMDNIYQLMINAESEKAVQAIQQIIDRLDVQVADKKAQILDCLLSQIKNFMISDYECETLTALLFIEALIERNYGMTTLYDSIRIGFSSKHKQIILKTVEIIKMRPLQQQEYNVLLTIAMDYFRSRTNKNVAIVQFVELFQLVPEICRFQIEQSGTLARDMWQYCIARREEEFSQCQFLLCKLFPSVCIQQIDAIFKERSSKMLIQQGVQLRMLFQIHEKESFSVQFLKDMKHASESYIKFILNKANFKDVDSFNDYFKLIAVILQFTDGLDIMLFQQIFDKLMANCYKVDVFTIVRMMFKYCTDSAKIQQFIPVVWLKYQDFLAKTFRKVPQDLFEGLLFCTEHCRINMQKCIDQLVVFYIIQGDITEDFFSIVQTLSQYEQNELNVQDSAFAKISEYLTRDSYVVSSATIVKQGAQQALKQFSFPFVFYLQLFRRMNFQYHNMLEYVFDNIMQYLDNENAVIRQSALEIILANLAKLQSQQVQRNAFLIKQVMDFILGESDDEILIYGIKQLIECEALHGLFHAQYIEQFIVYLLSTNLKLQEVVLKLLGRLLEHDGGQRNCMQLRNIFASKLKLLNNQQFQTDLCANLAFVKLAIQYCFRFLQAEGAIFSNLSAIEYQKLTEKESSALIVAFNQYISRFELASVPDYQLQYFCAFISYFLNQDIYSVNIQIMKFLQQLVNATGMSAVFYLMIPNLMERLIYLIKNSKNQQIKTEAVDSLVICGPINFNVALDQVDRNAISNFAAPKSMKQLILAKYTKRRQQDSELLTHGNIYFDDINHMLIDYDSIIYSKDSQLISKVEVIEKVLVIIKNSLRSDQDIVLQQASNALRLICQQAYQDGLRLNVLAHVKLICKAIREFSDVQSQQKLLGNLVYIIAKINYCANVAQYDIVESCLAVQKNEEQISNILAVLEEIQLALNQPLNVLDMYRKEDVIDLLTRMLLNCKNVNVCRRCLQDLLLFRNFFQFNEYQIVPLLLQIQRTSLETEMKQLCTDIILRFISFLGYKEQLSTTIFSAQMAEIKLIDSESYRRMVFQLMVVCCISNSKLLQAIIQDQQFFQPISPELFDFAIALHLIDQRSIQFGIDHLCYLFDQYCQQLHYSVKQGIQKVFLSKEELLLPAITDSSPESLVDMLTKQQASQTPNQLYIPYTYGKDNMQAVDEKADDVIFNPWQMSQCTTEKEWDVWFQKFVYYSIRLSNCKYLSFCSNLAEIDLLNQQQLFNSAILFSLQEPGKIEPKIQKLQQVLQRVFHKGTPNSIQLCFMNLIDYLNKYQINTSQLINQDALFDISEQYQAYTRSLRIRESQCNLFQQNAYLDSLFQCYKKLQFQDMANCLLQREQQILDYNYLFYIHHCFTNLLKHLDENRKQAINCIAIENIINKYQLPSIASIQSIQPENKQLFFENLLLDLSDSATMEYTSENLAKSIEHVLTGYFQQFAFLTSQDIKQLCQTALGIIVFQNRQAHQKIFNPKPSWLLASNNYGEAIALLADQVHSIKRYLLESSQEDSDINQLKESFQEYCNLTCQLISALFLQGQYTQVQNQADKYVDTTKKMQFLDPVRKDKQIAKFRASISHLMVQIYIDDDAKMAEWLAILPKDQEQIRLLSSAIKQARSGDFTTSIATLQQLYDLMGRLIQTTIQENYQRSYEYFVVLMQVLHLRQTIEFKLNPGKDKDVRMRRLLMQQTHRLMNIFPNVDYWQIILKIRRLLGDSFDDQKILVEYAMLCIKNGRLLLAKEILDGVLGDAPVNNFRIHKNTQHQYFISTDNYEAAIPEIKHGNPQTVYAYAKLLLSDTKVENQIAGYTHLLRLLYNCNKDVSFFDKLVIKVMHCINHFNSRQNEYQIQDDSQYKSLVNQSITNVVENYSASVTSDIPDASDVTTSSSYSRGECIGSASDKYSLVRQVVSDITCKFIGQQYDQITQQQLLILEYASTLTSNNEDLMFLSAQASYQLAESGTDSYTSVSFSQFARSQSLSMASSTDTENQTRGQYIAKALQFYFTCQRSERYQIQSDLMILQILFDNQNCNIAAPMLCQLFESSKAEYWLPVIPQLLSYSASQGFKYARYTNQILLALSVSHHELVLPQIVVASFNDELDVQQQFAKMIDISLRNRADGSASRLLQFNAELARVAQSLLEQAYDGIQACIPLLEVPASTQHQLQFFEQFSVLYQQLHEGISVSDGDYQLLQFAIQIKPMLDHAWALFKEALVRQSAVFLQDVKSVLIDASCKIWEQISGQCALDLAYISPLLFELRGSDIPLPGSQQACKQHGQRIFVNRVVPRMTIIQSKQRPRKMAFVGSDGEIYAFLLKGKEDLRQDERVMQFLRFADSLLRGDLQQLRLHAYPVVPLTNAAGLLFWVPNTNSLQNLILQQKLKQNDYDLQIQFRAAHYSVLSLPQRIDALKFSLRQIAPTALKQALFALAQGSEDYIAARGQFTKTLAAASVVGHILGLGDRHPGNILLNGEMQVVHIDYGDCFEVAMHREKYPEKTVFRLTRMIEAAMDVCGKDGIFGVWFKRVLQLLRENHLFIVGIFKGYLDSERLSVLRGKLQGRERWRPDLELSVDEQASAVIQSAANMENICQAYFGWAPFW